MSRRRFIQNAAGLLVPFAAGALLPASAGLLLPRKSLAQGWPRPGPGQRSFGAVEDTEYASRTEFGSQNSDTASSSLEATGTNRCGLVFVFWDNQPRTISSMTWGGVAMTDSGAGKINNGVGVNMQAFFILDADMGTGSKTITATLSGTTSELHVIAHYYRFVHQTTPIDTPVTNTLTGTSESQNFTGGVDDGVIGGLIADAAETVTSGNTDAGGGVAGSDYGFRCGRYNAAGTEVPLTFSWTTSTGAAFIGFVVNVA